MGAVRGAFGRQRTRSAGGTVARCTVGDGRGGYLVAPQHQIDAEGLPYALEKLPRKEAVGAEGLFALDLLGRISG